MQFRSVRALSALFVVLVAAVVASCSSNSGGTTAPTTPPNGPTFSLAFPATGTSNKIVFTDKGSWAYHCIPHQSFGMTGTVIVVAHGAAPDSQVVQVGASNTFTFSPSTVTIDSGGYVRWVNASGTLTHTVTRP